MQSCLVPGDRSCKRRSERLYIHERLPNPVIYGFGCKVLQDADENLKELSERTLQGLFVDLASSRSSGPRSTMIPRGLRPGNDLAVLVTAADPLNPDPGAGHLPQNKFTLAPAIGYAALRPHRSPTPDQIDRAFNSLLSLASILRRSQ